MVREQGQEKVSEMVVLVLIEELTLCSTVITKQTHTKVFLF